MIFYEGLDIEQWTRANMLYIVIAYLSAFGLILLYFAMKHRGKMLVRTKGTLREAETWVKPDWMHNKVVMKMPKDKNTGWSFTFNNKSLMYKSALFGAKKYFAVEVFPDATKAIEFDTETSTTTMPHWDKATEEKLFEAKVIKAAGETGQKLKVPMAIYLLILVNIGVSVFILLMASGRIKLG